MRTFTARTFCLKEPRERVIEHVRAVGCTFDNCRIGTPDPDALVSVRDVELIDCTVRNVIARPVQLRDVLIRNVKNAGDLMIVWAPLFERVILEGTLGAIKINQNPAPNASPALRARWATLQHAHYAGVDWALDLSKLRARTFDLEGVPASAVRRDPETQIVVTRKRLAGEVALARVKGLGDTLAFTLEQFLAGEAHDTVLVAPTGKPRKDYQPVLDAFRALRAAGLAEPD